MEGQWIIDVIGQEEYDRLFDADICIEERHCCSQIQSFRKDDKESFKKNLRELFCTVTKGRICLKMLNEHSFELVYDKRYTISIRSYAECYLEEKGIYSTKSPSKNVYFYFSGDCLYFKYHTCTSIHTISHIIHPKDMKKLIDEELDENLYPLSIYTKRRAKCRKSIVYFMTVFRKVFSRDICEMIGKMVYETSKNDYCWDIKKKK